MNSNRPQPEQPAFIPFLERAKHRFPGATFHGSGQFAVAVMDHRNVYLFDDFFETVDFMAGHPEYRLHELTEEPIKPRYSRLHRIAGEGQDE